MSESSIGTKPKTFRYQCPFCNTESADLIDNNETIVLQCKGCGRSVMFNGSKVVECAEHFQKLIAIVGDVHG